MSFLPQKLLWFSLSALLLVLLFGSQAAFACQTLTESQGATLRINSCHPDYSSPGVVSSCCASAACHRSISPVRHLENPEFTNLTKDRFPLLIEQRQTTPQTKTGMVFEQQLIPNPPKQLSTTITLVPRQALNFLRTTILLH